MEKWRESNLQLGTLANYKEVFLSLDGMLEEIAKLWKAI